MSYSFMAMLPDRGIVELSGPDAATFLRALITNDIDRAEPGQAIFAGFLTPKGKIISDFLMPEINGVELLKKARALQPETIRILLTGFADKENAIRAINEAGLYHYLEKPWDNDSLLNLVRNGLQQKSLRQQLTERVEEFERLMSDHSQLTDRHRSIERELEMAARVQRNLLPAELPKRIFAARSRSRTRASRGSIP